MQALLLNDTDSQETADNSLYMLVDSLFVSTLMSRYPSIYSVTIRNVLANLTLQCSRLYSDWIQYQNSLHTSLLVCRNVKMLTTFSVGYCARILCCYVCKTFYAVSTESTDDASNKHTHIASYWWFVGVYFQFVWFGCWLAFSWQGTNAALSFCRWTQRRFIDNMPMSWSSADCLVFPVDNTPQ